MLLLTGILQKLGLIFIARNILSWPCICCIFPSISHCLWNTRASPAPLSVSLPSSRNRRTATKKGLCWYSNLHIEMQSIWEKSLGTWLVLLGDYPPIPHSLFHRPNGRTEMKRFPEKNKFPGCFHTSLWKSKTSLKCSWYQSISCHPCPSIWLTDPPFHTWTGAVSHLLGLWCCQSPKHKARHCWARLLSCCCLTHAGVLKGTTWDILQLWLLPRDQEVQPCICWYLAGVTAVSGMECFYPAFYCSLEGEELFVPLTAGSDLFCLSFEGLAD